MLACLIMEKNTHCSSPFILQPTRITKKSKTLIHNVFFNSLEYSILTIIQFLNLQNNFTNKNSTTTRTQLYKQDFCFFNTDEFEKDLKSTFYNDSLDLSDTNNAFNDFFVN